MVTVCPYCVRKRSIGIGKKCECSAECCIRIGVPCCCANLCLVGVSMYEVQGTSMGQNGSIIHRFICNYSVSYRINQFIQEFYFVRGDGFA